MVVSRAFTTYMYSSTAPDTDQVVSEVPASASATKNISFKYFSSSGHAMKKGELPPQRVFTKRLNFMRPKSLSLTPSAIAKGAYTYKGLNINYICCTQ